MNHVLSTILLATGVAFMLIAAIGVVRFPDLFTRMHCSTKSATLGVSCVMLGAAIHFGNLTDSAKAAATIFFVLVTAPVGAHVLSRAAYLAGVPLWKGTLSDERRGGYEREISEAPPTRDDAE